MNKDNHILTDKERHEQLRSAYRVLKAENRKLKNRNKKEFSKVVLSLVMATYFIGLFFAIYAVNKILMDYPDSAIQALIALFGYIGAPISVSIAFYSWKAKHENTMKIKCANEDSEEG